MIVAAVDQKVLLVGVDPIDKVCIWVEQSTVTVSSVCVPLMTGCGEQIAPRLLISRTVSARLRAEAP